MVTTTELLRPSITVTSPDFSLLTQTQKGARAVSAAKEKGPRPAKARAITSERANPVFMKKQSRFNNQDSTIKIQQSRFNNQDSTIKIQQSTSNNQHPIINIQ